jgi:hypothetical protein
MRQGTIIETEEGFSISAFGLHYLDVSSMLG